MEKLIIIRTLAEMEQLSKYLEDKEYIAYDTETTGLEKDSEIIGFSVCAEPDTGYYVILSYWDTVAQKLVYLETREGAKAFLGKLKGKRLIMANAPFDCFMTVNNFGVQLIDDVFHDVIPGGHLLNENRRNGLKERGYELFGEEATAEQAEMRKSISANGGVLTKEKYELYKADVELIAKYGAKDAILTLKVFFNDVPELFDEGLDKFFYDDETMPLLRGPTYELNTVGLKIDVQKLQKLKGELQAEIMEARAFIYQEIDAHVKEKYKATTKATTFNINAGKQLAWLLFIKLGNDYGTLTKGGRELCRKLGWKVPYYPGARREFIRLCEDHAGHVYEEAKLNPKTKKLGRPKKIGKPWDYIACGKESLGRYSEKYRWVKKLLEYKKAEKLLGTYVLGIESKMRYGIIRPSFLQHGTTSGRYSCKAPNFQNLPRDDKRVKACIVSRPGKVFVGADYSQLEPRVFASTSGDESLLGCFERGEDFYSVTGAPIFGKDSLSLFKDEKNSFAKQFPKLRDASKIISLATPYGRTAMQQAAAMGIPIDEAQDLIDRYFGAYPKVKQMMLDSHEMAKKYGVVKNLFGRPRRIPKAKLIPQLFGDTSHAELPYDWRSLLNLAMNHRVQSTGASIMNRAAIRFYERCKARGWTDVHLVMQIHDELIVECPEHLGTEVVAELKDAMQNTTKLPGVALIAEPKIANNIADLK